MKPKMNEVKKELTVFEQFEKLTRPKKIEVLWEALDYMQQYNGRTKEQCVALAMGID